jgi:hypothetical protein
VWVNPYEKDNAFSYLEADSRAIKEINTYLEAKENGESHQKYSNFELNSDEEKSNLAYFRAYR